MSGDVHVRAREGGKEIQKREGEGEKTIRFACGLQGCERRPFLISVLHALLVLRSLLLT